MTEPLTLYIAKGCPYVQRVEIALIEVQADYKSCHIDLQNKPEWYLLKVNPIGKVPAIAYGGPQVSPDDPSDESEKIAKSLVILEFVADLYPNSPLLPKDPVLRARVRFFIDAVSTKFVPAFYGTIVHAESSDGFFKAVKAIQDLLPAEGKGEYAIGDEFTLADAAIAPFIGRVDLTLKNDLGAYQEGEGTKIYETLQSNTKFSRFRRYAQHLKDSEFQGNI